MEDKMFISKKLLQEKEACDEGVKLFEKLFPDGTEFDDNFVEINIEGEKDENSRKNKNRRINIYRRKNAEYQFGDKQYRRSYL